MCGKCVGPIEAQRAAPAQRAPGRRDVAASRAQRRENARPSRARPHAVAEQVAAAEHGDHIAPLGAVPPRRRIEQRERQRAFRALERAVQRALAYAGRARVSLAQHADRRAAAHGHALARERGTRQRVAHPDVAIEIRERGHGERIALAALDHHREPEPELAEPHRGRIQVHAEDRARQELTADRRDRPFVAEPLGERRHRFERVHEERA